MGKVLVSSDLSFRIVGAHMDDANCTCTPIDVIVRLQEFAKKCWDLH